MPVYRTIISMANGISPCAPFTPRRGIVMGRLRSPQRNLEVSLMKFCLQKLGEPTPAALGGAWVAGASVLDCLRPFVPCPAGLPVIGDVGEPGYLEGGEGRSLAKQRASVQLSLPCNPLVLFESSAAPPICLLTSHPSPPQATSSPPAATWRCWASACAQTSRWGPCQSNRGTVHWWHVGWGSE